VSTYGVLHSTKLVAHGRFAEAVAQATREIELSPEEPEALFNRAQALVGLQRLEEALADYARVLGADLSASGLDMAVVDDELFDTLRTLAVQQRNDPQRALATLERYRTLVPDGRHVDDVKKWSDNIKGIEVVWRRES
jgi:regulator of sirC expression with transglutaminase-like and TPR domain